MSPEVIFFLAVFSLLIGIWANRRGRSGVLWFLVSVVISPLLTWLLLLALGPAD